METPDRTTEVNDARENLDDAITDLESAVAGYDRGGGSEPIRRARICVSAAMDALIAAAVSSPSPEAG